MSKEELEVLMPNCNFETSEDVYDNLGCSPLDRNEVRDRSLVKKIKEGDSFSLNILVREKSVFVNKIISRDHEILTFKKRGLDYDDLFQSGMIGLINAVKKFDFREGIKFNTFLAKQVKYNIRNDFRDYGGISISREATSIYHRCSQKSFTYDGKLSLETLRLITEEMTVTNVKIADSIVGVKMRNAMFTFTCDGDVEGDEYIVDKYRKKVVEDYHARMDQFITYKQVINEMGKLTDKERYVVESVYLKDMPQKLVAEKLSCSNAAVSKIRKRAIETIRRSIGRVE